MAKTAIITRTYQDHAISYNADGWFSATQAAAKFGKEPTAWIRQSDTMAYIAALCKRQGNSGFVTEFNKIKDLDSASSKAVDAGFTASVGKQVYAFQTDKPPRGEARDVKSRFRARLAPEMRPREPHRPEPPSFTPSSRRNQYGERHHHPYLPRPRHQLRR